MIGAEIELLCPMRVPWRRVVAVPQCAACNGTRRAGTAARPGGTDDQR